VSQTTVVLDNQVFPECPRWRDGVLFFSDQHAKRVMRMTPDGTAQPVVEVAEQPSGLGWLPDGRMLVVEMKSRRVLRVESDGTLVEHADLSALAPSQCNDMVVDATGRAYVGNFGFDIYENEQPRATCMIAIEPDGATRIAAEGLRFPNGSVITDDGRTLLVGESMGQAITAFDVAPDGSLGNGREWATMPEGETVDGMCLDAEGAVWIASPFTGKVIRIREGGEVTDTVQATHPGAFACMLGGEDRRTLYICSAPSHVPEMTRKARQGRIEALEGGARAESTVASHPITTRNSAADQERMRARPAALRIRNGRRSADDNKRYVVQCAGVADEASHDVGSNALRTSRRCRLS
jgi:sugar lactone lactonase YvrE